MDIQQQGNETQQNEEIIQQFQKNSVVITPDQDQRQYKSIVLKNKLKVLLISDPETEQSAASLDVYVGGLECHNQKQGLAHFLQHMLFMGTQKYPNQNQYSVFLSQNSGDSNAWTDLMNTNYYFYCSNEAFEEGLDRFADFFSDPLFDETCLQKEINAVESEFQMSINDDSQRVNQVFHTLAQKESPMSIFLCGNQQTLEGPNGRDEMIDFYQTYYSANIMNLVIYGKEDIEKLEKMSIIFERLPNFDLERPVYTLQPYDENFLKKLIQVIPVMEEDTLTVYWQLDNLESNYREKYYRYTTHLLGHEGQNSLLAYLIQKGLATELCSSIYSYMNLISFIGVEITLTTQGFEQYVDVISALFEYIQILRQNPVQEWIWRELQETDEIQFRFKQKEGLENFTTNFSNQMCQIEIQDVYREPYLNGAFNADQIQRVLEELTFEKLVIVLSSQNFEKQESEDEGEGSDQWEDAEDDEEQNATEEKDTQQTSPSSPEKLQNSKDHEKEQTADAFQVQEHYGTQYLVEEIPLEVAEVFKSIRERDFTQTKAAEEEQLQTAQSSNLVLGFPQANRYIPKDFKIKSLGKQDQLPIYPERIENTDLNQVWFKQDQKFLVAKGIVYCHIYTDMSVSSTQYHVLLKLWEEIFENYLKETTYLAEMANVDLELKLFDQGVYLKFKGCNDSLPTFINDIFELIINFPYEQVIKSQFSTFYEKVETDCNNFYKESVEDMIDEFVSCCQSQEGQSPINLCIQALKTIEEKDLIDFSQNFLKNLRLEWYAGGNFEKEEILEISKQISVQLGQQDYKPLAVDKYPVTRINQLEPLLLYKYEFQLGEFHAEEPNSAISMSFFGPRLQPRTRIMFRLLVNHINQPAFNQLRTNEQLGYLVWSYSQIHIGILKFMFCIVSAVSDPNNLSHRINLFLDDFRKNTINNLGSEDFEKLKKSTLLTMVEKDKQLSHETDRYSSEITTRSYNFDRSKQFWKIVIKKTFKFLLFFSIPEQTAEDIMNTISIQEYKSQFENLFFKNRMCLEIHIVSKNHQEQQKNNSELYKQYYEKEQVKLTDTMSLREMCGKSNSIYPDYYFTNKKN